MRASQRLPPFGLSLRNDVPCARHDGRLCAGAGHERSGSVVSSPMVARTMAWPFSQKHAFPRNAKARRQLASSGALPSDEHEALEQS
jgi:hypothetical protein